MGISITATEYAGRALQELHELKFVSFQLVTDLQYDESVLQQRNKKWQGNTPITNDNFNSAAFRMFGRMLFCEAVDIYNWYCREVLKLALCRSPQLVVDVLRKGGGRVASAAAAAEKKGKDAATEIVAEFLHDRYRGERVIRQTIHVNLNVLQHPEMELLCTCRNVLVHKRGFDEFGEIAKEIQNLGSARATIGASLYPQGHMPIEVGSDQSLVINPKVGDWAAALIEQQIFMMDQNFAHIYKLPRKKYQSRSIGRTFLE